MICPYCKSEDIGVIDTRKYDTVNIRVRFCESCRTSFQTSEEIQLSTPVKIFPITSILPK